MAKKKKDEVGLSEMTPEELRVRLRDGRERLFQLRFRNSTAPIKNPWEIRATRRDIARVLTVLRQKGVPA